MEPTLEQPQRLILPPNLTFDPTSSFAPERKTRPSNINLEEKKNEEEDEGERNASNVDFDNGEVDEENERYIEIQPAVYAIPLPERLNVEVHTLFAPEHSTLTGTLILEETVFGKDPIRVDLLKRAVNYYRNKKRGRRKAKTKALSEVSGSRRKVRQQKGTGQARAGHSRPAHWRGGYKAHGPKNDTDYGNTKLNKKVRRLAMRHVLSQKLKEGNLLILDRMYDLPTHKTNELAKLLDPWDIAGNNSFSALCIDHYVPEKDQPEAYNSLPVNLIAASKNLPFWTLGNTNTKATVYEILRHDKLLLTVSAMQHLEERLKE